MEPKHVYYAQNYIEASKNGFNYMLEYIKQEKVILILFFQQFLSKFILVAKMRMLRPLLSHPLKSRLIIKFDHL